MLYVEKGYLAHAGQLPDVVSITLNTPTETEKKISSFATLHNGWDYGRGGPISQVTLDAAFEWNRFLRAHGFLETDAFPGSDGEVVLAAGYGDHYLEIIIEPDGKISVAYDYQGKQELYRPNMTPPEATGVILQLVGQIWNISAYFTPISSTSALKSSSDPRFAIRSQMGAYLSSKWIVLNNLEHQSAPTSDNTSWDFEELWEIRPYSGSLNQPYFLQATR